MEKYRIEVHFENCARLTWKETFDSTYTIDDFLDCLTNDEVFYSKDADNERHICFNMKYVTGVIIDKIREEDFEYPLNGNDYLAIKPYNWNLKEEVDE